MTIFELGFFACGALVSVWLGGITYDATGNPLAALAGSFVGVLLPYAGLSMLQVIFGRLQEGRWSLDQWRPRRDAVLMFALLVIPPMCIAQVVYAATQSLWFAFAVMMGGFCLLWEGAGMVLRSRKNARVQALQGGVRYWYANCPRCKQEGELFIARIAGEQELCLVCDECSWYCRSPADIDDYSGGREGYTLEFEWPSLQEIRAAGWEEYCKHTEG